MLFKVAIVTINDDSSDNNDENDESEHSENPEDCIVSRWRDEFLQSWPWLIYDMQTDTATCRYRECRMYSPFLICLCRKWKHSWENRLFRQHANTAKHKHQSPRDPAPDQAILQLTPTLKFIEDPAVWVRIQSAWCLAKEDVAIHKFGTLVESHLISKGFVPMYYMDDKTAWEMIMILGKHFRQILTTRVQHSAYYGIMIDETTDHSTISQLIVYIKFLEKDAKTGVMETKIEYLDLITSTGGTAYEITVPSNATRINGRKLFIIA